MFNIKVLCFFIFTLSFVLSFPDNFYKSLEENYGSDNEDVAKTIREESVDQDGNKHTRDNENMAEIIREEFIDQYGNKHTREFEIKRSAVTNKRKKRDSDNLIGCNHAKPPLSGSLTCKNYGETEFCQATCIDKYKFPDGSIVKSYNCSFNGNIWSKIEIIPDCEPAIPGIGCNIVIGQKQFSVCVTDPRVQRCRSECIDGYNYPDGSKEIITTCTKSDGKYDPVKEIPDCEIAGVEDTEDKSSTEANNFEPGVEDTEDKNSTEANI